jgi:hypothetical protein
MVERVVLKTNPTLIKVGVVCYAEKTITLPSSQKLL